MLLPPPVALLSRAMVCLCQVNWTCQCGRERDAEDRQAPSQPGNTQTAPPDDDEMIIVVGRNICERGRLYQCMDCTGGRAVEVVVGVVGGEHSLAHARGSPPRIKTRRSCLGWKERIVFHHPPPTRPGDSVVWMAGLSIGILCVWWEWKWNGMKRGGDDWQGIARRRRKRQKQNHNLKSVCSVTSWAKY